MTTSRRIELLAAQASVLEPWLGRFTAADLEAWLADQLGDARALDTWIPRGPIQSHAAPLTPVLHIISGNTPHAGFQSLFRGLLIGGHQRVKLPSAGLPALEAWIDNLPEPLATLIETSHDLRDDWRDSPVAIIFGDGTTMDFFRDWCPPTTRRIEHGPKLSAAILFAEPEKEILAVLADDILREDQRGCLSVQNILCDADAIDIRAFARSLAAALDTARATTLPCPPRTLSESGSIRNFREILRYRAANGAPVELHESADSTAWTVILDATPDAPLLTPTPGGGTVFVRAFNARSWDLQSQSVVGTFCPQQPLTPETLGPEHANLSTIVAHPFDAPATLTQLESLAPPRICAPGMAQFPGLFWSHDGTRPLADLVRWRDLG